MSRFAVFLIVALVVVPSLAKAQGPVNDPPRVDDHFWRRRVMMAIDLREKINAPIVRDEVGESSQLYTPGNNMYGTRQGLANNQGFGNRRGLLRALLDGLKDLKYPGFNPDSLSIPRTYEQMLDMARPYLSSAGTGAGAGTPAAADEGGGEEAGLGDDWGDFGDDFGDEGGDEGGGDALDLGGPGGASASDVDEVIAGAQFRLELVEDRIFDKNKSDMYFDIHYVRLVWVDPAGQLPKDLMLVAFRYEDVLPVLADTQYKNFYNDAENRNMQEMFELRLFRGYIVDISGNVSQTLEEAEKRRQQMVEFEHHLWEF